MSHDNILSAATMRVTDSFRGTNEKEGAARLGGMKGLMQGDLAELLAESAVERNTIQGPPTT